MVINMLSAIIPHRETGAPINTRNSQVRLYCTSLIRRMYGTMTAELHGERIADYYAYLLSLAWAGLKIQCVQL